MKVQKIGIMKLLTMQSKLIFHKSLNPIPSIIRHNELLVQWKLFKKSRRQMGREFNLEAPTVSFKVFLDFQGIDFTEYINKPLNRLEYYSRFGRYLNNKRI